MPRKRFAVLLPLALAGCQTLAGGASQVANVLGGAASQVTNRGLPAPDWKVSTPDYSGYPGKEIWVVEKDAFGSTTVCSGDATRGISFPDKFPNNSVSYFRSGPAEAVRLSELPADQDVVIIPNYLVPQYKTVDPRMPAGWNVVSPEYIGLGVNYTDKMETEGLDGKPVAGYASYASTFLGSSLQRHCESIVLKAQILDLRPDEEVKGIAVHALPAPDYSDASISRIFSLLPVTLPVANPWKTPLASAGGRQAPSPADATISEPYIWSNGKGSSLTSPPADQFFNLGNSVTAPTVCPDGKTIGVAQCPPPDSDRNQSPWHGRALQIYNRGLWPS